jgi:cytochrome c-type biogenesis protein CcmH/NrfG
MAPSYKDILSHLSTDIDQETLLLYLQNKLSPEKKHEVEKQLLRHEFDDEALEGLQDFKDKEQLLYMVEMLNRDLRKKTEKKKKQREKWKIKYQPWIYVSILILLLLIVLSYLAVRYYLNK